MKTILLSSGIWQTVYQKAQHTWNSTAPGCCVWDAPQQPPVLFNFHWSDQVSELNLSHASLADLLDTNPPSINYLQKWCPTTLFPPSFPSSSTPACSGQKNPSNSQETSKTSPAESCLMGRLRSGVQDQDLGFTGLSQAYVNYTAKIFMGLHLCYIKRIRDCSLRN